jgi:methylglutaconyl-CoA hydratase
MVKYSVEQNTATITLARPEKRNALNPELVQNLLISFKKADEDPDVKTVILTGEGKTFCAGADLQYLSSLREHDMLHNEKDSAMLADLFLYIYNLNKPIIAAVNGAAIAGGCGLATVCDFIVASPESKFGYSEVKIGFLPAIVSIFLIKRLGEGSARSILLSSEIITGERAREIGLVNFLVPDVQKYSKELAANLNNNSQSSMKMTKEMIRNISNLNVNEAVEYCIRLNAISRTTKDFINGINSFLSEPK